MGQYDGANATIARPTHGMIRQMGYLFRVMKATLLA